MNSGEEFQDYLPLMVEKLGEDGLMQELAKGFDLLADPRSQTITFQSLKSNGPMIGLPQMTDCELHRMISEGDSNGRGELDLHDFCVLMVRTSPVLMCMAKELVKSCAKTKSAIETQQVHVLVIKEGLQSEPLVGTALIDIYGKCGLIIQARKLFEDLLSRDVVAWTALIAGYAEYGAWIQTMKLLEQMQVEGISPNAVTYLCILKGLGSVHALDCGHQVYIDIISYGFETDLYVGSTLVDFYGKCGSVLEAEAVFKMLPQRNEFSWNALISAYAEDNGHSEKLFRMLDQMQTEGFSPDAVTYICSLKSCSTAGNLERGRYMHMEIVKCELDMAVSVSNSLVCMYAKCGSLAEAENAFDRLPQHNIISWTALLVGYAEHGIDDKAIMCFDQMQSRGLCLDAMTFIGILKAVIRQKDRMRGQDVHLLIIKEGFEADLFIGNSLIDFYSQSGLLLEALDILQEMPSRDVISWNSLAHAKGSSCSRCDHIDVWLEGMFLTR